MSLEKYEIKIKELLGKIEHPSYHKNLMELGMFSSLEQIDDKFHLLLKTANPERKIQIELEARIRKSLANVPSFIGKVKIKFEIDESLKEKENNRLPGVKKIIAIGSGKGGVGKSTVSANLAVSLAQDGKKVGILDADIYGPSIGSMFGVSGRLELSGDGKNNIYPHVAHGVKMVSFSFLLGKSQAVVWRGPMLGKAIEQFLFQVVWGELDYLIFDLPPGTGDVQLSMAQLVKVDGGVIVTTPQNVALQDARRASQMFLNLKIPILGVIENMSSFVCPSCGASSHVFSKNGGKALASDINVPFLGSLPLQEEIMESGEKGLPFVLDQKSSPTTEICRGICQLIASESQKGQEAKGNA